MFTSDLVPGQAPGKPEFANTEPVPFRLTPNIQNFITPIGIEGVLVTGIMSIARALTESEVSLRSCIPTIALILTHLCIAVRSRASTCYLRLR